MLPPVHPGPEAVDSSLSRHVLLVDDDEKSREIYRRILEIAKLAVETASSGVEALRFARERTPAVILLDLMMPGMDGGAVLQQLKRDDRTKAIPVIALTGVPEWLQAHREPALDFADVLFKPVPHETLVERIRQIAFGTA